MIQLYKSKRAVHNSLELIEDIDTKFDYLYYSGVINLDSTDFKIMKQMDRIKRCDGQFMTTPYGSGISVTKLSTGCKTCLLARRLKDVVISLDQCGPNALDVALGMDNRQYLMSFLIIPDKELSIEIKVNSGKIIVKDIDSLAEVYDR